MTFRDPAVAAQLNERFIESRLHMDQPDRVATELFEEHVKLRDELIGSSAMPYYAIIEPRTGEFLFRAHLRGGDEELWKKDFLAMFSKLPDLKAE